MERKPNLRHHSTQKNYIAIWYSIIFHLFLFIAAVNYVDVDYKSFFENLFPAELESRINENTEKNINHFFREDRYSADIFSANCLTVKRNFNESKL